MPPETKNQQNTSPWEDISDLEGTTPAPADNVDDSEPQPVPRIIIPEQNSK